MTGRITPERQQILDALSGERLEPRQIAERTGMDPANVRKLLHGMRTAGLVTPYPHGTRTAYTASITDTPAVTVSPTAPDRGITVPEELPIGKPNPGVIGAYSVADGGMISNAELRRRKGYRDA